MLEFLLVESFGRSRRAGARSARGIACNFGRGTTGTIYVHIITATANENLCARIQRTNVASTRVAGVPVGRRNTVADVNASAIRRRRRDSGSSPGGFAPVCPKIYSRALPEAVVPPVGPMHRYGDLASWHGRWTCACEETRPLGKRTVNCWTRACHPRN